MGDGLYTSYHWVRDQAKPQATQRQTRETTLYTFSFLQLKSITTFFDLDFLVLLSTPKVTLFQFKFKFVPVCSIQLVSFTTVDERRSQINSSVIRKALKYTAVCI